MNEQTRTMPKQKPGKSWQDVGTPKWLLKLVERTWGTITYDAAASMENHACAKYSDGLVPYQDGLKTDWEASSSTNMSGYDDEGDYTYNIVPGLTWVNPPYSNIAPWVQKAAESDCLVVMLVPASVGSNWWKEWVHDKAAVYFLSPRLTFVGHTEPYTKDCALLVYGAESPRYRCVRVTEDDVTISKGDDDGLN